MSADLENIPNTVRTLTVEEAKREPIDLEEPLIIRGAFDRTRMTWTEEWLIAFMEEKPCVVSLDSRPALRPHSKASSMSDFLEQQRVERESGEPPMDGRSMEYLFHPEVDPRRTIEVLGYVDLPRSFMQLGRPLLYQLYVGPAWSGTLPHVHTDAINALARGRKRWAVYVGRDERHHEALRQESISGYGSGSQAAPWFATECPKLRSQGIRLWEFVQEPGDVVFVPASYLHAVLNLEPVVGFSAEFRQRAS